jgi:pullulanase/glycogen debranching enzyme
MQSQPKSVVLQDPAGEQTHATLPYPLGPTITANGTNFCVFSASATRMELVLFDHADDPGHPRLSLSIRSSIVRLTTGTSSYLELSRGNFTGIAPMVPTIRRTGSVLTARKS